MAKSQSPAFDQVLETFQSALINDQDVGSDVAARLMKLLESDDAINAVKIEAALFPPKATQGVSE